MSAPHFADWLDRADPGADAIADDTAVLSYGQLADGARRLAGALAGTHGRGRFVLLRAERTVGFLRALLGVSLSGNVPVPFDPQAPAPVAEELARTCGPDAFVLDETRLPEAAPLDARDPDLPALVLFTSGTSGVPKGVVISQANVAHSVTTIAAYLDYPAFPSAAVVLPLHYSYALLSQVFCMLAVGGRTRLFASFRNPLKFAGAVNAEGVQTFCGVPSTYQALGTLARLTTLAMPGVRVLCSAGAAMDRGLVPQLREIFPAARFYDNYGMTEATPRLTFIRDDDPRFDEPTCGRAMDGVEIRILDEQTLEPLPDGRPGIVAVRGANVFSGYLNDPEATAEAFTAEGFLVSGDLGELRDGYLYLTGRRDEVFNVAGEKVAPLEIERVLARHASVESCAVGRLDDAQRGLVPAAFLKLREPTPRRDLVAFLSAHLSPAKVPVRYFEVGAFPLTPNGKLQRSRLSPDDASLGARELT